MYQALATVTLGCGIWITNDLDMPFSYGTFSRFIVLHNLSAPEASDVSKVTYLKLKLPVSFPWFPRPSDLHQLQPQFDHLSTQLSHTYCQTQISISGPDLVSLKFHQFFETSLMHEV